MKNLQSLKDIFGPITIKRPIKVFYSDGQIKS